MKTITGECRYCEQIQTVAIDNLEETAEFTKEQIEETIVKNCTCEEAIEYQTKLCNIQKAKEVINRLPGTHWTKDFLNETIDLIMDGHFGSITLSIDAGTTVYIKKKPDGSLSVKRKDVDIEEEII